ncbi:MAG: hypothetical protein DCF18_13945 [Cyanobium sp.]|uniref:type II secretion system protein GspK n=1 Tax=Synechococcus sp. CS-1333 TaxID=2848638 RepID=UPI000DBBDC59|nr:type II secretion system protein GspK [Synechococcus sp. CS-1333]MCT0210546.1 hypothetical protein [Synechococcus sp. CS-1333]PZV20492.1 MAG: hypothetical protein DCF18_13945 [Cyanobium sp.]
MARGHWLDPLARRLLIATGQIAPPPPPLRREPASSNAATDTAGAGGGPEPVGADAAVERELMALKLKQNPGLRLRDAAQVRHAAALGWRLDVNRATPADWLRLPGCEPHQVDLLLRLQAGGVQLSGEDDLQRLLGLSDAQLQCWLPLLEFRWYGEPAPLRPVPLDVNRCSAEQLQARLPLDPPRCQRLVRERGRGPFQDLADLQQRLQLPPHLVEALIGKVSFGRGPVGPDLPRPTPAPQRQRP